MILGLCLSKAHVYLRQSMSVEGQNQESSNFRPSGHRKLKKKHEHNGNGHFDCGNKKRRYLHHRQERLPSKTEKRGRRGRGLKIETIPEVRNIFLVVAV